MENAFIVGVENPPTVGKILCHFEGKHPFLTHSESEISKKVPLIGAIMLKKDIS